MNDMRFCRVMVDDAGDEHICVQEIQIKEAIESSNLRPTIPPDTPPAVAKLISSCWATVPEERPSFNIITEELSNILEIHHECDPQLINLHMLSHRNRFSHTLTSLELNTKRKSDTNFTEIFDYSYSVSLPPQCTPLCMIVFGGSVWCGCDTGHILIWDSTVSIIF